MPRRWGDAALPSALGLEARGTRARDGVLAGLALAAAGAAVWATLEAGFLRYPGWLAAQKADFILGPVLVGLYWLRVRPASRFGWLLIAYGLVAAVYIAQSSSVPWLFTTGNYWELIIYLATEALILTFPTGRLERPGAKGIMLMAVIGVGVPT